MEVPKTMKALVAYGKDDYRLELNSPTPECGPDDIIIKTEACGICAGDLKCSHGAANVENALKAVKGVVSAEAQLEDKTVTVEFDGQQASEDDLKAAVDATGRYELTD